MAATSDWWHFDTQHVFFALACTAAGCCLLFIAWKVAQMVRIARKRQLLAKHVQDGYVFLGETNVALEYSCPEKDTRHYRLLEAAQTL
uniref:Putative conserved plasma membrane protein n=1 Tax=Amblyomma tuberculatum TaxID=48802 RepID=A0A6M2E0S5_9ACAR